MQKRIIAQGAEAILYIENNALIKERIPKTYRLPQIDQQLRLSRTRKEAKIMQKVPFAPKIISVDEKNMSITMEYLTAPRLKEQLDVMNKKQRKNVCLELGKKLASLHQQDIIHGDLTTNNMLYDGKLYFIDFGLSVISNKIEDKAVDLHLLKQAFHGRHHTHAEESFAWILKSYTTYNKAKAILERLEKVERRGRYKAKL
ncbi:MAG: KEOPS complex kinase/ATPase Bud32 [Nanoarchaeota archaeon]|nr:KEOPS complex kinase/ATPase Bud32 [Nanoarchaeota archaeon]